MVNAEERIHLAKVRLCAGRTKETAFLSVFAMSWKVIEDNSIPTMATDGTRLFFNKKFVNGLDDDKLLGVIKHEAVHDALFHTHRLLYAVSERKTRSLTQMKFGWSPRLRNIAMDLEVNSKFMKDKSQLPTGAIFPETGHFKDFPADQPAEWYFNELVQNADEPWIRDMLEGGDDPGMSGTCIPPGDCEDDSSGEMERSRQRHARKMIEAISKASNKPGNLPGFEKDLEAFQKSIVQPRVDYKRLLSEFLTKSILANQTWCPPSRRFFTRGIYMPGVKTQCSGDIVISVDSSGSCWSPEVRQEFAGNVKAILSAFPEVEADLISNDTMVRSHKKWKSGDPMELEIVGGGGTNHIPVFQWIDQNVRNPHCAIMLTDLYTVFPKKRPKYPVLWVCNTPAHRPTPDVPFGIVARM